MKFQWSWSYAWEVLPQLLEGMQVTILATLIGSCIAFTGGLVLDLLRRVRFWPVSAAAKFTVEFVRGTPLLVQLFFVYYSLPALGLTISPFTAGVAALGVHYSAYAAEVYRAGIDAVPRGQIDAAIALGLSPADRFLRVIFPQALPPIVPALGNYLVAMFKDTPVLSTITVLEMLYVARDIGSESFRYLEPLTLVGLLFLAVSLVAAAGVRRLEAALAFRFGGKTS